MADMKVEKFKRFTFEGVNAINEAEHSRQAMIKNVGAERVGELVYAPAERVYFEVVML